MYIEGKLQTRKWQDQSGNDRYTTEIVVNEMQMRDTRGNTGEDLGNGYAQRDSQSQAPTTDQSTAGGDADFDDDIPTPSVAGSSPAGRAIPTEEPDMEKTRDDIKASRMLDEVNAKYMLEMAMKHGLSSHLFADPDAPMCLVGTQTSIERLGRLLERMDEMEETIEELQEKLQSCERAEAQISEALNMGDGVYRP